MKQIYYGLKIHVSLVRFRLRAPRRLLCVGNSGFLAINAFSRNFIVSVSI